MTPKLPLKFILLWMLNLAVIVTLVLVTGIHDKLLSIPRISSKTPVAIYLALGALLAALEWELIEKLRGN